MSFLSETLFCLHSLPKSNTELSLKSRFQRKDQSPDVIISFTLILSPQNRIFRGFWQSSSNMRVKGEAKNIACTAHRVALWCELSVAMFALKRYIHLAGPL